MQKDFFKSFLNHKNLRKNFYPEFDNTFFVKEVVIDDKPPNLKS